VTDPYEGWAIVELMGHRRLAGQVAQAEQYGTAMLRLDVFTDGDEPIATQFYGGSAVYCVTPTTEPLARAVASRDQPRPVAAWELPRAPTAADIDNAELVDADDLEPERTGDRW
jgi:hypothetical protein